MALEKRWEAILPIPLSMNGTAQGILTIPSTKGFKVKHEVYLLSDTQQPIILQVKKVLSKIQLVLGPVGKPLSTTTDISAYLVSDNAQISAKVQERPSIPLTEHERAVYEEEPTVAKRVFIVDDLGNGWDEENPLPVLATVSDNAPANPLFYNKVYLTSGAEDSFIIPNNTKKLYLGVRGLNATLKVSFNEGGTITGVGSSYITIPMGNSYFREGLKLIGKTLYYQASKDNLVIEIEAWV